MEQGATTGAVYGDGAATSGESPSPGETRERRLRVLSQLAERLLGAETAVDIARAAFDSIAAEFDLQAYFNYLVEPDGSLRLDSWAGIPEPAARLVSRLAPGQAVCGLVVQGGEPVQAADIQGSGEPRVELLRRHGYRAYFCNALTAGGRLLGTLSFGTRNRDRFSDEEVDLLHTVTRYVALAEQRLRAERELRENVAQSRQVAEGLPQLVWTARADGSFEYLNGRWYHYTGMSPGEAFGDGWTGALHPHDRDRAADRWRQCVRTGYEFEIEYRLRRGADGAYRWFLGRGLPLRDGRGEIVRWFGTATEINDYKEAREALRRSEQLLRATFENAAVGIAHVARDGSWVRVNQRFCEITGYPEEEILQLRFQDITHPDDVARDVELTRRMYEGELPYFVLEKRYVRNGGSTVWVEITVSPLPVDGRYGGYHICVVQDISERKRLEQELAAARETAEEASRAKDSFLANMSHEIRTPMNGIMGMTELLLDSTLDEGQRQYLDMIKGSAEALLNVINDVLDFAKIEAGKLELEAVEFELRAVVESAAEAVAFRAHQKGLEVVVFVEPDLPDLHVGDPGRLRQVLLNLLSNAVKFTERGEVVVHVERSPDRPSRLDRCWLRFSVEDTGIGISREKQERLFESFTQADPSVSRRYGGTGLGLAISKRIVDEMGGRIWLSSREGEGSTFSFEVEVVTLEARAPCETQPPLDLAGVRALVVDDSAASRRFLSALLESRGAAVVQTERGRDAVDRILAAWRGGRAFDLALVDQHLPDVDGFSVLERVREGPPVESYAVLLLTSEDVPGAARRARAAGAGRYVLKPVRPAQLLDAVGAVRGLKLREGATPGDEPRPREPRRLEVRPGVRVLLAEDNPVNRTVVEAFLGRRSVSVRSVQNGAEALEALETDTYDLVLMDVQMPEVDGYEATRRLRRRGHRLPIVGLTAHAMKGDREKCLEAGMDDYLPKPVSPEELYRKVARWTGAAPAAEAPAEEPAGLVKLLETLAGDRDVLEALVRELRGTAESLLPELGEALRAGDPDRLQRAAHKLKGGLLVFEAREAAQPAEELERLGRAGSTEGAGELLHDLETAVARLLDFLEREG